MKKNSNNFSDITDKPVEIVDSELTQNTLLNDQNQLDFDGNERFEVDLAALFNDPDFIALFNNMGNEYEFTNSPTFSAHSEETFSNNEHLPSNNSNNEHLQSNNSNNEHLRSNSNNEHLRSDNSNPTDSFNSFFEPQPTVNTSIPKPPGPPPQNIVVGSSYKWHFEYKEEQNAYFLNMDPEEQKNRQNELDEFCKYENRQASKFVKQLIKSENNTLSIDIEKYNKLISFEQSIIRPDKFKEFGFTNSVHITNEQPCTLEVAIERMKQDNYPEHIIMGGGLPRYKFTLHDGTYFHRVVNDPDIAFEYFKKKCNFIQTSGLHIKEHPDHIHVYWTLEDYKIFIKNCSDQPDLLPILDLKLQFVFSVKKVNEADRLASIDNQIPSSLKQQANYPQKRSYEAPVADVQTLALSFQPAPPKKPRESENFKDNKPMYRPPHEVNSDSLKKFTSLTKEELALLFQVNTKKKKSAPPPPTKNSYKK